jgi:hypothetical protein
MPLRADDDVVMHRNSKPLGRIDDAAGDVDIRAAGRGVAGWMIMDEATKVSKVLILKR